MNCFKYLILPLLINLSVFSLLHGQTDRTDIIRSQVSRSDIELNVHFLSSDELRGRLAGTHEIDIAAQYIASWFKSRGVEAAPGVDSYFQPMELRIDSARVINTRNVIGIVRGSDPTLRDEYVMLSAHYDHVGVRPTEAGSDSIYNGARDNAVGVATIMAAGKYFADNPPIRSILIAAWTAEEMGLRGSGWFAENPMVPLNWIVYNLNIDGAGYNDTTKVTIVGLNRTSADSILKSSVQAFGLEAIPSPVPELNLFNRSDNVHFARRGIPAPTFSLGFTAFNEELTRYYHQPADESTTLNFDYITDYVYAYILSAEKIANAEETPFWKPGDEYEQAGNQLYGRE